MRYGWITIRLEFKKINMAKKIRWGILSTAKIGMQKVIPAIQNATNCEVVAISSRTQEKAEKAAKILGIKKAVDSYDAILNDPEIDAVYNPLPNHLHVSWTIKALQAGKHVLCEKPIGMNVQDAEVLAEEIKKHPELKMMEAFMYRFHPQWKKVKSLVDSGAIGDVKNIHTHFSYNNPDPKNIRNILEVGGGALMDIGCYCISFPRFIFGKEPARVISIMDRDPLMKTDRLTSGILDFSDGVTSLFTCSTQLMPFQRTQIFGTSGRIEVEIPVNAPPDQNVKILISTTEKIEEIEFPAADQYQIQTEKFAKAILDDSAVPTNFSDAINNMKVIDAIVSSSEKNEWVNC